MNRIFKTLWSSVRQGYVVTNETHASKGKASKSLVAASVALAALGMANAGTASASYADPGFTAASNMNLNSARASWETNEYRANWGLTAQKASAAYALGYHGQGVKVGMMDSGFLKSHSELTGERWHGVTASGKYEHDGERYPQYAYGSNPKDTGKFTAGSSFSVDGYYDPSINDNHGTGCVGVMAGNRNGSGMHGVAWGSEIYSANTGGTDDTNYGPFPDYGFFKAGYDALVNSGVKIINNSFGTNLKQVDENGNILDYYHSGPELTTVNDIEYEYFIFKRNYGSHKTFVDAAWESIQGKDVIQVFTNGNNDRANPYHRALYPYFNPDAEKQWIAIAGLRQLDKNTNPNNYKLEANFNEAGYAKYWTLVGPGQNGYTSNISGGYGGYSGTSMAAPFVTGAFAVLQSRYPSMSAVQVREVLLTTSNHKNLDGSDMSGWANVDGTTPKEGEVSDRMGWGVPNLEKGMYGPGQLFNGNFKYDMSKTKLDVWSNDISEVALNQRQNEDLAWKASLKIENGKVVVSNDPDDYKLTNTSTGAANADGKPHDYDLAGVENKKITLAEAMEWRRAYQQERLDAIKDREYDGSITKLGSGTLVMTGRNTYEGTTTVEGGTLLAFTESIGTKNAVTVAKGGTFGILSAYNDQFTLTGYKESKYTKDDLVTVTVKDGGTLYVSAGSDTELASVTFEGAKNIVVGIQGAASGKLLDAYHGDAPVTSTLKVGSGDFSGAKITAANEDSAFFETALNAPAAKAATASNELTVGMQKKDGVSFGTYASNGREAAVASALENTRNDFAGYVLGLSAEGVSDVYAGLSDDFYASARNSLAVNSLMVARTVSDQARGMGEGRSAEFENGIGRVWAAGIGTWGEAKGGAQDLDVDFRTGLVGVEFNVVESTKIGAFFGGGSTDYKGANGKIDADNLNYGLYGLSDIGQVALTYGVAYTSEDRDTTHALAGVFNSHSEDASVLQVYGEAAYTGLSVAALKVEPYVGFAWAKVKTDGFTESTEIDDFAVNEVDDDIQVSTLGTRFTMPFNWATLPVAVKADLGWSHFYGDTESVTELQLGKGGAYAQIEGNELKDQFNLGLGIEAQVAKSATVGVSYVGAWGSDTNAHGVTANFRWSF